MLWLSGAARPGLIALADRAREAGQWDIAAQYYRKSLDHNPRNWAIWVQYGHALKESGHLAEAEAAYRRALADAPEVADSHLQLGHVLKLQGKTEEAKTAYLRALLMFDRLSAEPLRELADLGWPESKPSVLSRRTFADPGKTPTVEPTAIVKDDPRMENAFQKWRSGITHERDFWSWYLKTGGAQWKDIYAFATDPEAILQQTLVEILRNTAQPGCNNFRLLEVGAGPLSPLGKKIPDATLEIVATDPLADVYDELLAKNQIEPVVRTQFAVAEDLSAFFAPSSFDMVHCSNALDHSFEPMRGIVEMLRVVKVNCAVVLGHFRNEAEHENYIGFHQHNFDVINDRFVIWNKEVRITVEDALPVPCNVINTLNESNNYVQTVITKCAEFTDTHDIDRRDKRMRAVYQQMIGAVRPC